VHGVGWAIATFSRAGRSLSTCVVAPSSFMYALGLLFPSLATSAMRGDNSAFPFSTRNAACMSLPCSFWSCFSGACFVLLFSGAL